MNKETFELFSTEYASILVEVHKYENGKSLYFLVESSGYKGHGPLYLRKDVEKYIEELTTMSSSLSGECCISDTESTTFFIRIFFEERELWINGNIGDYSHHALAFAFKVDQTLLMPFVNILEQLL